MEVPATSLMAAMARKNRKSFTAKTPSSPRIPGDWSGIKRTMAFRSRRWMRKKAAAAAVRDSIPVTVNTIRQSRSMDRKLAISGPA